MKFKEYTFKIKPEHNPLVVEYLKALYTVHVPAIDAAESKEDWQKAFEAYHQRGYDFYKQLAVLYPETKGMAVGLVTDSENANDYFIRVQGRLKDMTDRLARGDVDPSIYQSLTAKKLEEGHKRYFGRGLFE